MLHGVNMPLCLFHSFRSYPSAAARACECIQSLFMERLSRVYVLQGEISKNVVFLISFWGDQIGQKVQKICDW